MISKPRVHTDFEQWHVWFAWRPVRVYAGKSRMYVWAWGHNIERKFHPRYDDYVVEYRLIK